MTAARSRQVKVVMVGDMCVGKTSLAQVFVNDVFRERYSASVGGAFQAKTIPPPINTTLQIWDTAGMERFRSMLPHFMREAHCALIVYNVCDRGSFTSVKDYWIDYVDSTAERENIVKILVANKIDISKENHTVRDSEGRRLAERHDMFFISTSAKFKLNVTELFTEAGRLINKNIPEPKDEHKAYYLEPVGRSSPLGKKKLGCCAKS